MAIFPITDQYKYKGRGPFDAKALVKTYADLLNTTTWTEDSTLIAYNGMITAVWLNKDDSSKNGIYYLFDPNVKNALGKPDVTNEANWHKLVSGEIENYDDTELANRIKAIEDDYLKTIDKYDDTVIINKLKELEDLVKEIAEVAQTAEEVVDIINTKIAEANLNQYAVKSDVTAALNNKVDISSYNADKETFATKANLEGMASEAYVDNKISSVKIPAKLSELQNDTGYITVIPDSYVTKEFLKAFNHTVKYEVLPHEGMFVDYRGNEIRINTSRVKPSAQQAGPTATPNQYYIQFRAYAPENAVAYKEWQGDKRDETVHTFDEAFSGTDKFGRNYSLIWMSIASFDGNEWSLYGDKSTTDKYLGFYYTFEWFDQDNNLIDTNKVRVILTNDACHNDLIPDAISKKIDEKIAKIDLTEYVTNDSFETYKAETVTNLTSLTNNINSLTSKVGNNTSSIASINDRLANLIQPKESNELSVAVDGTIGVKEINIEKIVQSTDDILILNGGNA